MQECTTAEEYKELLTLMEERLRVMRQVQFHALIAAMMVMMVVMRMMMVMVVVMVMRQVQFHALIPAIMMMIAIVIMIVKRFSQVANIFKRIANLIQSGQIEA